jgi:hypothetical protein
MLDKNSLLEHFSISYEMMETRYHFAMQPVRDAHDVFCLALGATCKSEKRGVKVVERTKR